MWGFVIGQARHCSFVCRAGRRRGGERGLCRAGVRILVWRGRRLEFCLRGSGGRWSGRRRGGRRRLLLSERVSWMLYCAGADGTYEDYGPTVSGRGVGEGRFIRGVVLGLRESLSA